MIENVNERGRNNDNGEEIRAGKKGQQRGRGEDRRERRAVVNQRHHLVQVFQSEPACIWFLPPTPVLKDFLS